MTARHDEAIRWDTGRAIYVDFLTSQSVTPEVFEDTQYVLGGYAGNTDPDIYGAFRDFNADVSRDERYTEYWYYVEDQVLNYEHLLRSIDPQLPGAAQEQEDISYWHQKLQAEYNRLFTPCGACGQQHANPEDCDLHPTKELPPEDGVTVNVRVWVATHIDNPYQMLRDLLHQSEDPKPAWIDVLEMFIEDPE